MNLNLFSKTILTLCIISISLGGCLAYRNDIDQNDVFDSILKNTNYDLRQKPGEPYQPVNVSTSVYMYFLGHIDVETLEFEALLQIRHRWRDSRLMFRNADLNYSDVVMGLSALEGETWFSDRIWTPNIFIENEQTSEVMQLLRDNIFIRIDPRGMVQMNYRVTTRVFCNMDLHRFPHDEQQCYLRLESWTLDSKDMILFWDPTSPLDTDDFFMPEYNLVATNTRNGIACYTGNFPSPRSRRGLFNKKPRDTFDPVYDECYKNGLSRNFSVLFLDVGLRRQIGPYFLDYYVPSMLLVFMSWISFWLHPSAIPGRTTLGTSTWLTFMTLTHNTGTSQLPKVSYIKFLDIWFLVCTVFIFASLLEFAVVNNISRRKETVTVKDITAKNMLPAAAQVFASPAVRRKSGATPPPKARNLTSIEAEDRVAQSTVTSMDSAISNDCERYRIASTMSLPSISLPDGTELTFENRVHNEPPLSKDLEEQKEKHARFGINFEDMTSEELAIWLDMKARILFPILFLIFNIIYWTFALRVDCSLFYNCNNKN